MTLAGCDVASFQGLPGAWKDAAGDIAWAAVKVTELSAGNVRYLNPDAAADVAWLRQQHKGVVLYLFAHPSVSADETVSYFASEVARLGLEDGDGIALDLETNDGTVTAAKVAEWAAGVLAALKAQFDREPLLYTYRNFAGGGNCAGLAGYPLWISDPSSPAGKPAVPSPWSGWAVHQYSTSGGIDRDVASYATLADMRRALGKKAPRKVARWRVTGVKTLAGVAKRHGTTPEEMLRLAADRHHKYRPAMKRYIERADWTARLPVGVVLFAYET